MLHPRKLQKLIFLDRFFLVGNQLINFQNLIFFELITDNNQEFFFAFTVDKIINLLTKAQFYTTIRKRVQIRIHDTRND